MNDISALQLRTRQDDLIRQNSIVAERLAAGVPTDKIIDTKRLPAGIDANDILISSKLAEIHRMSTGQAFGAMPYILSSAYGDKYDKKTVLMDLFKTSEPFKVKSKYNSELIKKQIELEKAQLATRTPEELKKSIEQVFEIDPYKEVDKNLVNEKALYQQHYNNNFNVLDPSFEKEEFFKEYVAATDEKGRRAAENNRYLRLMGQRQRQVEAFDNWQEKQKKRLLEPDNVWMRKIKAFERGGVRTDVALMDTGAILLGIAGKIPGLASYKEAATELSNLSHAFYRTLDLPEMNIQEGGAFDQMTNALFENVPFMALATAATVVTGGGAGAIFLTATGYEGSGIYHNCLEKGLGEKSSKIRGFIGGVINGALEAQGGGARKYFPKSLGGKLVSFGKQLTTNALREVFMEELPQEAVSAILTGDVPYNDDGTIDWKQVTNNIVRIARDTAFMSLVFTSTGTLAETGTDFQNKRNAGIAAFQVQKAWEALKEVAKEEQVIIEKLPAITPAVPVKVSDDITVETPPIDVSVNVLIENSPSYGINQILDEKGNPTDRYAVLDWETQQEIKGDLSKKEALTMSKDLNTGVMTPPTITRQVLSPDSDVLAMTYTQLINNVLGVSKTKRQAASNAAKVILAMHKDLAAYAKAELAKIDITQAQRNSLLQKIATAKNDIDRMEAAVLIEAMAEQQSHIAEIKKFNKLRKFVNRAAKLRLRDGGIPANVYSNLRDILDNYTSLPQKVINSIKRSKAYLEGIREKTKGTFSADYAEALMPKSLINKFGLIDASNLADKTAEEIKGINDTIKQYLAQAQLYSRIIQGKFKRTARAYLDYAVANIKFEQKYSLLDKIPSRGITKNLYDAFIGIKNHDIYTIINTIWGKESMPFALDILRMRDMQGKIHLELQEMFRNALIGIDPATLRLWSHQYSLFESKTAQQIEQKLGKGVAEYTFNINGQDISFSMAELMSFYMGVQDKYWRKQFVRNGGAMLDWISGKHRRLGQLDVKIISELLDAVNGNPQAKKFCDNLIVVKNKMQELLNTTSRNLDGFDIATVENQWHVEYVSEGGVIGTEFVRDSIMDEDGRLRPRTSSKRMVVIRDIFQVLAEDMRVVSNFSGMSENVRKLRMLANYMPFREKMITTGKEHILKELDSRIHSIQTDISPPQEAIVKLAMRVSSNARKSILTGLQIIGVQPMSASLYATEVDLKYMAALRLKIPTEIYNDFLKNWTLLQTRAEGISSASSVVTHGISKKIFSGKGTTTDYVLMPLHKGDLWGVSRAGLITLAEMSDKNLDGISLDWWQRYGVNPLQLKYGTKEFWDAFNDRAGWLVTLTQPMFNAENRSAYTNSDNPLVREFFRFRGFVDQLMRIPSRQLSLMQYGQISLTRGTLNIANAIVLSSILKVITQTILGALLGKEKEADEFISELITTPLSLIPVFGYPAQRIVSKAMGVGKFAPSFSTVGFMMGENVLRHSWQIATGLNYYFNEEYYRSGKFIGQKKSTVALKKGLIGAIEDGLIISGFPARAITQIEWFKNE